MFSLLKEQFDARRWSFYSVNGTWEVEDEETHKKEFAFKVKLIRDQVLKAKSDCCIGFALIRPHPDVESIKYFEDLVNMINVDEKVVNV